MNNKYRSIQIATAVFVLGTVGAMAKPADQQPAEKKPLSRVEQAKLSGTKPLLEETVQFTGLRTPPSKKYCLWYDKPSHSWSDALPVGNGRLAAMVYGGIKSEILTLGEDTLWGGPPKVIEMPDSIEGIKEARKLCFEGKIPEAEKVLLSKIFPPGIISSSYQFLGQINMELDINGEITDYQRDMDMSTAVASVSYNVDGVPFSREVFVSPVDDVIVIRLTAEKPGLITGKMAILRDNKRKLEQLDAVSSSRLVMSGQCYQAVRPRNKQIFDYITESDCETLGTKYAAHYQVVSKGGTVATVEDHRLGHAFQFKGCDEVLIYVTAATDYNKKDPYAPLSTDLNAKCEAILKQAMTKKFQTLENDSVAAHREAFARVDLSLGKSDKAHLPTDERIRAVTDETPDTQLEALLYQYARYLLICSSRPGTQTMGLQGLWSTGTKAPWNGDYHININQQMNYWPAETGNLSEYHEPFFDMIDGLRPVGKKFAREALGCRGFMAAHTTDLYYYVSNFGKLKYGMWVVGGAWCSAHMMEHYRYTGDTGFLQERAFPVIKECALFFLDWLVEDPATGKLVSGPTCSPENKFSIEGTGVGGQVSMGPAMDQEIIWETFTNYLEALDELGIQDELADDVRKALAKLDPPKIGKNGRILEWSKEAFLEMELGHRHVSHLYAVYPGFQFSWNKTPELMEAAKKSLEFRLANAGGQTGWSRAWTINFWARFLDGNKAHDNLVVALKNNSYDNLFNVNPPFIIDGNFGYGSGIAEMLLQSHAGELHLLPALPSVWAEGSVSGLCARDGFEVDMKWKSGKIIAAKVRSKLGKDCTVRFGNTVKTFKTKPGQEYDLKPVLGL
ncbi:glycoside hydrolase family 95 protein [Pontiella sulfatireligans]|uniref:Uncharacterized protein n=1 Tax=Pontiella sulfatireligans TaxID=2750658 RepID=A0A6C2UEQ8_9BACT|nr:glycoside hydrolase family 95 protein [Pontiella sulfatireligans]VGO18017.1 hypothetical protein SCARR_00067 [Pontiella sulfatireligans]